MYEIKVKEHTKKSGKKGKGKEKRTEEDCKSNYLLEF